MNRKPKKLTQINDINRIRDTYTEDSSWAAKIRQNIFISKFRSLDLEYCLESYCSQNLWGQVRLNKIHPCRAKQMSSQLQLKMTIRRLPNIDSYEYADDSRFSFFTKKLWDKIY